MSRADPLEPELLLRAYAMGVFPMADDREAASVYWVEPKWRKAQSIRADERIRRPREKFNDCRSTAKISFQ